MKKIVEFELEAGNIIFVEIDEPEVFEGTANAGRVSDVLEKAQQTFDEAISNIWPTVNIIANKLPTLSKRPDEISIEFGFKLSANAGVILAAAGSEVNFKVAMKWVKEKKKEETPIAEVTPPLVVPSED